MSVSPFPPNPAPAVSFGGPRRPIPLPPIIAPSTRPPRFPQTLSYVPLVEGIVEAPLPDVPVEHPLGFSISRPSSSSGDTVSSGSSASGFSAVTETAPLMAGGIAKCLIPTPRFVSAEWTWSIPYRRPNPCTPSEARECHNPPR